MKGISLPHSSYCSFTAIDDHRALVFGGNVAGRRVDNLYLIDFNIMVIVFVAWLPQPQCMHFAGWESVSLYGFAALVRFLISCTFMSFSVLLLLIDASIMSSSP